MSKFRLFHSSLPIFNGLYVVNGFTAHMYYIELYERNIPRQVEWRLFIYRQVRVPTTEYKKEEGKLREQEVVVAAK